MDATPGIVVERNSIHDDDDESIYPSRDLIAVSGSPGSLGSQQMRSESLQVLWYQQQV
jgi:hypothetical protein